MKNIFAQRLKQLRTDKGLTQEQLAKHLKCSRSTVCKLEKAITEPWITVVYNAAVYFNVTSNYLAGLSNERKRKKTPRGAD